MRACPSFPPGDEALLHVQFDRYQRLFAVASVVVELVPERGRVLDVGGHPCDLRFFVPRHRVVVADLPRGGDGPYVCADGAHLPFVDGVFDVVTSVDVLEHVPARKRAQFLSELFRVSRGWVVLGVPRGAREVEEAERAVDAFYRALHGEPHPWLAEHFAHRLPTREDVEALLRSLGARFTRRPNGYLPRWGLAMLSNRLLETLPSAGQRLARFNAAYNHTYTGCDSREPAYRDIYVATRGELPLPLEPSKGADPGMDPLVASFLAAAEGDLKLSDEPSVAAVVVTCNHEGCVGECVRALRASRGARVEPIVVDNGSTDGSVREALDAGALVIHRGYNAGFAAAFNLGWRMSRAEIILSVNPDVVVSPDAIWELSRSLLEDATLGVTGATLWDGEGRQVVHAGGVILPSFCTVHRARGETTAPSDPCEVDYVTGGLLATKRWVLEACGGLDEAYWPAYYEETDFCVKVKRRGMRVVYWPWAQARHQEASTLGRASFEFFRAYHRGRLRFIERHLPLRRLPSWWRAEREFRAGRRPDDVEIRGLREAWRGWWWRLPLALGSRGLKGLLRWRMSLS